MNGAIREPTRRDRNTPYCDFSDSELWDELRVLRDEQAEAASQIKLWSAIRKQRGLDVDVVIAELQARQRRPRDDS